MKLFYYSSLLQLLHRFIFNEVFDRNNRKRLRNCEGFMLQPYSQEILDNINKLNSEFSLNELVSIANILGIDASGTQDALCTRIVNDLNL